MPVTCDEQAQMMYVPLTLGKKAHSCLCMTATVAQPSKGMDPNLVSAGQKSKTNFSDEVRKGLGPIQDMGMNRA